MSILSIVCSLKERGGDNVTRPVPKNTGTTWRCQDCGLTVNVTTGNSDKEIHGDLLCCNQLMKKI